MLETGDFSGCWLLAVQPHGVHPARNSPGWDLNISYIYTGLTQRSSKPICSSAGEDDQVKCELSFHSWGFSNHWYGPSEVYDLEDTPWAQAHCPWASQWCFNCGSCPEVQRLRHRVLAGWADKVICSSHGICDPHLTISSLRRCLHNLWQKRGCLAS